MKTEIISFYSDVDGTSYYSDCAKTLASQLTEFNIPHDIREKESLGSYQKNCLSKPQFIYSMLAEKKKPLLWLDVDSTLLKEPVVFDEFEDTTDIAYSCSSMDQATVSLKASPLYFNYNNNVKSFLENWINLSDRLAAEGKWFDHEALIGMMQTYSQLENYSFKYVGPDYCVWPGSENESSVIVM